MKINIFKLFIFCFLFLSSLTVFANDDETYIVEGTKYEHLQFGLPYKSDKLLERRGFALGYSKKYRQALWISYVLSAERLLGVKLRRRNVFRVDPDIKYRPVSPKDYRKSGYDRGHLAAAADMQYSKDTIKHSFYMTNISPQIPLFNRGIWKRLETQVRAWAIKEKKIYIITGPVFRKRNKRLGEARIAVPVAFYKVIFDMTPPRKMIAFIIPNAPSRKHFKVFAVSVDKVEEVTGYDFFSGLDDKIENELESSCDFKQWE